MDEFEKLASERIPNQRNILEAVDEYTLYCFYSNIENLRPGCTYRSPLRDDYKPSFVFYETKKFNDCQYLWKDMATGESGGIFKLVKMLIGLDSYKEVYQRIASDFALLEKEDKEKIVWHQRPENEPLRLHVSPIPLDQLGREYWNQFSINEELLAEYLTTQIGAYWIEIAGKRAIRDIYPPSFAYEINSYYQLYSPRAPKTQKFKQDWPDDYFFGYLQLPKGGHSLIIDKSAKDVIFCRRLGLWAVAGKSETTPIPHHKMMELKERFTDVYLMLDNDNAGIRQTERYMARYPWLKPRFLDEAKDKTDLCLKIGFEQTKNTIYKLLEYEQEAKPSGNS